VLYIARASVFVMNLSVIIFATSVHRSTASGQKFLRRAYLYCCACAQNKPPLPSRLARGKSREKSKCARRAITENVISNRIKLVIRRPSDNTEIVFLKNKKP
jgi:hypothetical protein